MNKVWYTTRYNKYYYLKLLLQHSLTSSACVANVILGNNSIHYNVVVSYFFNIILYHLKNNNSLIFSGVIMLWAYAMMGRKLCSVRPPFDINEGSCSTQQVRSGGSLANSILCLGGDIKHICHCVRVVHFRCEF